MTQLSAPSLSIVTVVRNDRAGLARTLRSLQGQADLDFEWVVVDGQSTDGTWESLHDLQLPFRSRLLSSPPKGIYDAMNRAVQVASGDWLWFINAGDFLLGPDAVRMAKQLIEGNLPAGLIGTPVEVVTAAGFLYDVVMPRLREDGQRRYAEFHHQGALTSAHAFRLVNGFDVNLSLAADGDLLDRMAALVPVEVANDRLVAFVLGGASSRRIRWTLQQIRQYRVPAADERSDMSVAVRQRFRDLLMAPAPRPLRMAVTRFFLRREQRVLASLRDTSSSIAHWPDHVRDAHSGHRSCCL